MLHQDKIKYPLEWGCSIADVSQLIKEDFSALREKARKTNWRSLLEVMKQLQLYILSLVDDSLCLDVVLWMHEMNLHRHIALWYKHLTQCFWFLYTDVYYNSSAIVMSMSEEKNPQMFTYLHGNVSRKSISFIATSKLTSMLLSSAATVLSVGWIESTSAEITLVCWQHPKSKPLYTWHFSTFNQHVLLSTTIYCKIKNTQHSCTL